jgi:hypothetical protein
MRKMTILNEDYIYLQQKLAEALDEAAYEIREELQEVIQLVESFIESLSEEEKQNYKVTPQYINFKNNKELREYFISDEIETNAIESIRRIKKLNEFSLEESSLLSKYYAKIFKEEVEDEFEEAVLIFGKNNVDIPETDENLFRIIVSEAGIMNAIRIFGMVPGMTSQIKESIKKSNNIQILKEGLERLRLLDEFTGFLSDKKDLIQDQLTEEYILNELSQFLKEELSEEELSFLNEGVLNEGKLLDKIRWKLALFSLRFLREESINKFLEAYHSDKEGKPTEKSKSIRSLNRKEKLSKMRELANSMSQEEKDKIANNPQAKKLEKMALVSGLISGISGAGAIAAGVTPNNLSNTQAELSARSDKLAVDSATFRMHGGTDPRFNMVKYNYFDGTNSYDLGADKLLAQSNNLRNQANVLSAVLPLLTSVLFGAMWGAIIISGVSAVKGLRSAAKAQTLRRDEIIKELLNKNKRA